MIHESDMAKYFLTEDVNATCYIDNRISYFHQFERKETKHILLSPVWMYMLNLEQQI